MADSPQPPDSPSPQSSSISDPTNDEDGAAATGVPLTMAASVVLEHLPKNTQHALETAGELALPKVTIRLSPLPNTPALKQPRFKCSSSQRFEAIVRFLRKKLGVKEHEGVYCYVNSVFAPGLDEGVGNLWRCFKTGDELVVSYSITQAFG
ncbi:APG12-domain-containing protein [Polychaeton citri CBS 116435]|uniref:Ubiquitin-like protein ATG12 n=1 Tax=Polychaeton citri CBS 116435 TaxID=1314669 RepID=A0A9P4Q278_9PEZI|nr:APG12-domain-containing protein [Polychaeton citri CBS 116435]